MKLLIYGINYYPEEIGIAKYTTEMCEWFAANGHTVYVITSMPYYPNWEVHSTYKKKWWHKERINGVTVFRNPLFVPKQVTGLSRIIHEISFMISSVISWIRLVWVKFDVVISIAPPLQLGLPMLFYSSFHRTITIYHIQDLQMDAAKNLGLLKDGFLLKFVALVEKYILRKTSTVSTISEGMAQKIEMKGVAKSKIFFLRNWTDTKFFYPDVKNRSIRQQFELKQSARIILYSGNIGEKQGLDIIIEVAKNFKNEDITFLIIGEGAFKQKLIDLIAVNRLENVKLLPLQPTSKLNDILNMADLHLVLQKKVAADLVMPSKLTNILAVGGVSIVTAEEGTSLHKIVTEHKLGYITEPENPIQLTQNIRLALVSDLQVYKRNARAYAEKFLDRDVILNDFQSLLIANRHF